MKQRRGKVGLWSGMVAGVLALACGPVTEVEAPRNEAQVEQFASGQPWRPDLDDYEPAPRMMSRPALAYGGGKFLAVWQDQETRRIYGTRVKPDGTVLDPEGIRLNVGSELPFSTSAAVAYDGSNFMIVWGTAEGITGVRMRPDGTLLGGEFPVVTTDRVVPVPSISCAPKVCLVVYPLPGPMNYSVHFTPVRTDGTPVLEEPVLLAPGYGNSVAWNGKEFLAVWADSRADDDNTEIYGARVAPDGTVRDPGGFPIAVRPGGRFDPDVVWTGRRFLVAWEQWPGLHDEDGYDIYGARVRSDGRVDDPGGFPISTAPGSQTSVHLAHHNSKTLVVWQDARDGLTRIWGARVTEEGRVRDPSGFAISSGSYASERTPDVAYGSGRFFVGFGGVTDPQTGLEPKYLLGARVNHDAKVLDSPARVLTFTPRAPEARRTAASKKQMTP